LGIVVNKDIGVAIRIDEILVDPAGVGEDSQDLGIANIACGSSTNPRCSL
jgi:hypothetical protein